MNIKKHIPNLLTLCNLVSGCIGIVYAFGNDLSSASWFIWASLIFDFLDGFSARLLKVNSEIGKELDSLADVITFGVLPSCMIYQLIQLQSSSQFLPYIGFSIAAFSALRLARFNLDAGQQEDFIGVPTPANALLISAFPFIHARYPEILSIEVLVVICPVLSWLLISNLRLFSLKFKNYTWKDNWVRFTFLGISVLLLAFLNIYGVPVMIFTYLLLSLLHFYIIV